MPPASRFETGNAALSSSRISSPQRPRQATRTRPQARGQVPRPNGRTRNRARRKDRTPPPPPPVGPGERPAWNATFASKRRGFARKRSHTTHDHISTTMSHPEQALARNPKTASPQQFTRKRRPRTTTSRPPSRRTSRRDRRRDASSSRPTTPSQVTGARKDRDICEGGSSGPWSASTASSSPNSATSRPG